MSKRLTVPARRMSPGAWFVRRFCCRPGLNGAELPETSPSSRRTVNLHRRSEWSRVAGSC
jgi:hypothetical protein